MGRRLLDIVLATTGLVLGAPLLLCAAVGIRLTSRGPVLYRARRVGRDGVPFTMYKLRTMHVVQDPGASRVTSAHDARVFAFGAWLRRTKLDELPQLLNVLRGEMSVIGPRPEDPEIVRAHYQAVHWETLRVRPGLASPGSIFNYTHGEALLGEEAPERDYVDRLLPLKLALDVVYVRRASFRYDATVAARTALVIIHSLLGRRHFRAPPELAAAELLLMSDSSNSTLARTRHITTSTASQGR